MLAIKFRTTNYALKFPSPLAEIYANNIRNKTVDISTQPVEIRWHKTINTNSNGLIQQKYGQYKI